MEVSNITLENGVISVYFKHTDYCIKTECTFKAYRMYCEFNNLPLNSYTEVGEMIAVNTIKWDSTFAELVAY